MFVLQKVRGQTQPVGAPIVAEGKIKICSWNVNGLQGIVKKKFSDYPLYSQHPTEIEMGTEPTKSRAVVNCLDHFIDTEQPDILCLQEIRCSDKFQWRPSLKVDVRNGVHSPTYTYAYHSKERKGYSGTLVWSRFRPLSVHYGIDDLQSTINADEKIETDAEIRIAQEGRVITLEFESFYLVNVYAPNSGTMIDDKGGRKRLKYRTQVWEPAFRAHVDKLKLKAKSVVVVGDLNCLPEAIDSAYSPSRTAGMAGSSMEERICFRELLAGNVKTSTVDKLVDSFRALNSTKQKYSWGPGAPKRGCRLDFALCSAKIEIVAADILSYPGSDHLPITLTVAIPTVPSSSSSSSAAEEFKHS